MSRAWCRLMAALATIGAVLRGDTHPITCLILGVIALAWLHASLYGGPLTDEPDELEYWDRAS